MVGKVSGTSVEKWLVLFVLSGVTMLDFGIIYAFGAMFVAMMDTFQSDRFSTATVQSLLIGISLSFSVVSGALVTRFGVLVVTSVASFLVPFGFCMSVFVEEIQYLYITISIISGIGISTIHVVSIVIIQHTFPSCLHPLCFAIHGMGVNIAGILYPMLIEKLLDNYDVHGIFLIFGGLFLNSVAAPLLLFNNKKFRTADSQKDEKSKCSDNSPDVDNYGAESDNILTHETEHTKSSKDRVFFPGDKVKGIENSDCKNQSDLEQSDAVSVSECIAKFSYSSLLTKQYTFLLIASALCIPALNTFLGLTVDIFVWKGFTVSQGLLSFVPFNVFGLLSKFIPVLAKKYTKRLNCFVLPMCFCIAGLLSQLLVYISTNYILMLVGTSLAGLSLGGVFPAMLIAGAKIVSKREWPVASGLIITVIGVLSSGLGPVFGSLRDRTGAYTTAIITIGILQAAGALLYMLALISRRKNQLIRTRPPENIPPEITSMKER